MPGKYTKYRGKLPVFQNESSYQKKVDVEKQSFSQHFETTEQLAEQLATERRIKESYEERLKHINCRMEALSQLLVDRLETDNMERVVLSGGVSVGLYDGVYPAVDDETKFYAWVDAEGLDDLYTVHYQTLKGMCGELLAEGKEPPPGVKVYLKTQARVRDGGNGGQE
jgi:hypothetical protein